VNRKIKIPFNWIVVVVEYQNCSEDQTTEYLRNVS